MIYKQTLLIVKNKQHKNFLNRNATDKNRYLLKEQTVKKTGPIFSYKILLKAK